VGGKIAYVMSRFPNLSETFILREMSELREQGWDISIYPLIYQNQPVTHSEIQSWLSRVRKVPLGSTPTWGAAWSTTFHRPNQWIRLCLRTLWENRTDLNLLTRAIVLLPQAARMAQLMVQEGIQHIHAHYATHPALVAWIIHRLTGISYSVTVHAHDIFVRTAMLGTKLREAKFVVAISNYNKQHISGLIGDWVEAKTSVIHCGIRPTAYIAQSTPYQSDRVFEILNIGSLQPYKGQAYLIEACALLHQKKIPFRCRIIGAGEERQNLERLIADRNLIDHVLLLGPQDQETVAKLLASTDCYVQPSIVTRSGKMEGIPVALMEALASAIPVVATAISGIPELVLPQQTGWLVPPANALALAEAIECIYTSPLTAHQIAKAGCEMVLREFTLRENVSKLSTLLATAI